MSAPTARLDTAKILRGLKDFQRDTVDYVFDRLYGNTEPTRRFLIADEVGLGKTLVARGVIARAIDHLWENTERIDIIYICSNADIARQNINRLNITEEKDFVLASRITLLPTALQKLRERRLNFVSFTPGTSFDLKSSLGRMEERALLYWLLRDAWSLKGKAPKNVFQGNAATGRFRQSVKHFPDREIDAGLAADFVRALDRHIQLERQEGQATLRDRFDNLCERFAHSRNRIPPDDRYDRACLIGELRTLLAVTCLKALEPDLVILDEFQRFKYLLEGEGELSRLARDLFEYQEARVLLLSATPYKMYTLAHEAAEDDHYADLLRTLRFLQSSPQQTARFEQLLTEYRRELFRLRQDNGERFRVLKQELEMRLRSVMVRTERLAVTEDRDGMLKEVCSSAVRLDPRDLESYTALQSLARILEQGDMLEYWKAAPYLLNFMDEYKFKETFDEVRDLPELEARTVEVLARSRGLLLPWTDISTYSEIDPGNARLRGLLADTVGAGVWRLLWMPPSLPYYRLEGPYAAPSLASFTKRLVFSCWRVVPRVVALLLSYEAERRMIRSLEKEPENSPDARKRRRPLLRFTRTDDRLTGMPVLGLIYPSTTLARLGDPLGLALEFGSGADLPNVRQLLDRVQQRLTPLLHAIGARESQGAVDEAWYWAAPILLDLHADPEATRGWWTESDRAELWAGETSQEDEDGEESLWSAHVEHAQQLFDDKLHLGAPPADLPLVLAQMALAGPAIAALRALGRVSGGPEVLAMSEVKDSAAQVGWSFLHLFNLPEVTALLRGMNSEEPYWQRVLEYCVCGGLQAVLDEYAHTLRESRGLLDKPPTKIASEVSDAMRSALTLRTSSLGVDEVGVEPLMQKVALTDRTMRARFALRFGEEKSEDGKQAMRADQVREAFNSPFCPFVLATTSVGQEGLDFHPYCHAVVHWNLPSNPVDLEQREGRVHRYKGHAVRKNLALRYGLGAIKDEKADPWEALFVAAQRDRPSHLSDLEPFWVYTVEGGAKIERHVPALPLSRDLERLTALRRSLAVYRMVFGQNRQEDLIAYLLTQFSKSEIQKVVRDLSIDLAPPRVSRSNEGTGLLHG